MPTIHRHVTAAGFILTCGAFALLGPGCSSADPSEKASHSAAALDDDAGGGVDAACVPEKCPTDVCNLQMNDGCGNILSCNTCLKGETCVNSYCSNVCQPDHCPSDGTCGQLADGCGSWMNCGCSSGQTCQNGTCQAQCVSNGCGPSDCGSTTDNCGNTIWCGGSGGGGSECADACGHPINDGQDCTFSPLNEVGRCFDGQCMEGT